MAHQNMIKKERIDCNVREYEIDIPGSGLIRIVIQEANVFNLEAAILPVHHARSFQISISDNGRYAGLIDNRLGGGIYGYLRRDIHEYLHNNLDMLLPSKIPRDRKILESFLEEFSSRRRINY